MTFLPAVREYIRQATVWLAIIGLLAPYLGSPSLAAQQPASNPAATSPAASSPAASSPAAPDPDRFLAPRENALSIPEDRGAAALSQSLKRLGTWASVMMIVAHPDDEDGSMLTYETRGQGVRASLMTLTRGEGGQNSMSADEYDALGLMRTNELLEAGEYYGVKQYWGTEADFGFSKTQEESFARWTRERVLYDTVLAIRRERPLVLVSSFIGGITDGHGQHQVSGEISQEAFLAAGDPKVFPDQIAAGFAPWSPRKVYARVPFAPVNDKGMYDSATGKWSPVRFYNYVTKQWSTAIPSADVSIPVGHYDPILGRSYTQIAREGWGYQKSQYGGANPTLSGGDGSEYHLYASKTSSESAAAKSSGEEDNFFAGIPVDLAGLATLVSGPQPAWLKPGLEAIAAPVARARKNYQITQPEAIAPDLKAGYLATQTLRARVVSSSLGADDKSALTAELDTKLAQFQTALALALGLDLQAFTVRGNERQGGNGPGGGNGPDQTPRSVVPGQSILVRVHTGDASGKAPLIRAWLQSTDGLSWINQVSQSAPEAVAPKPQAEASLTADTVLAAQVPANAAPTEPYFTRPSIAQTYYDISDPSLRDLSFAPYPLNAWAEFDYDGAKIRLGEVVQTMQREVGQGGVFEPLIVTPPVGVRVEPDARILPVSSATAKQAGSPLPVRVTVHTEVAADGVVRLRLPAGWTSSPAEASFLRTQPGDTGPLQFEVTPPPGAPAMSGAEIALHAEADFAGRTYTTGWTTIGYPGLRPYNLYRPAEMKTRAVNVKLAQHSGQPLRVGYVMGTGDTVPDAIEGLGITPHLLSTQEISSADLSAWDVIVIGIRAYSNRPELARSQQRLNAYVKAGGNLVVQYQGSTFPAPYPLALGRSPQNVVEEDTPVKLLAPNDPLLTWPNRITEHDFDGWVEERGHSFLESWDPAYTALTETADAGQDPQRGGLIVAHPGKGTYIYAAYALYRQFPELVPGSYRILANLLSAGEQSTAPATSPAQ